MVKVLLYSVEEFRASRLCVPGYGAAEIQLDCVEGHTILGTEAKRAILTWALYNTKLQHQVIHPQAFLVNRLIGNLQQWLYRVNMVFLLFPKDRNCELCERTNISRALCRKHTGNPVLRAENVGDKITTDHKVLSEECESRTNHWYAVELQDLATQRMQSYVEEFTKVFRAVGKAESH